MLQPSKCRCPSINQRPPSLDLSRVEQANRFFVVKTTSSYFTILDITTTNNSNNKTVETLLRSTGAFESSLFDVIFLKGHWNKRVGLESLAEPVATEAPRDNRTVRVPCALKPRQTPERCEETLKFQRSCHLTDRHSGGCCTEKCKSLWSRCASISSRRREGAEHGTDYLVITNPDQPPAVVRRRRPDECMSEPVILLDIIWIFTRRMCSIQ